MGLCARAAPRAQLPRLPLPVTLELAAGMTFEMPSNALCAPVANPSSWLAPLTVGLCSVEPTACRYPLSVVMTCCTWPGRSPAPVGAVSTEIPPRAELIAVAACVAAVLAWFVACLEPSSTPTSVVDSDLIRGDQRCERLDDLASVRDGWARLLRRLNHHLLLLGPTAIR